MGSSVRGGGRGHYPHSTNTVERGYCGPKRDKLGRGGGNRSYEKGNLKWDGGWGVNAPMLNILIFWGYTLDPYNSSYAYLIRSGNLCHVCKVQNLVLEHYF